MKKYFLMIFIAFLVAALTGCMRKNNVSDNTSPMNMADADFSEADYEKLYALQLDGYEDMTISDYQNRVWKLTDTTEYRDLLERFSKSEMLYEMKDTNETASFLFYVLEPLTAENWKTRYYKGVVTSNFETPDDNATVEYTFTLDILDADVLTVREYRDKISDVIKAMQNVLKNKTKEELQLSNENAILAEIQDYVNDIQGDIQTKEMSVAIDYAYIPMIAIEGEQQDAGCDENTRQESRRYANGTKEDYCSLLALKTADYQNMTLADFNMALLDWANEDYERMERIGEDIAWDDFRVSLTTGELAFVKSTVFLSNMENGKYAKYAKSHHAGQDEGYSIYDECFPAIYDEYFPLIYSEYLPPKTIEESGNTAWCSLYYQFYYCIADPRNITVGERDACIGEMLHAVHKFWNGTGMEDMLQMNEQDMVMELQKIAMANSTRDITISMNKEQIHFECMDER